MSSAKFAFRCAVAAVFLGVCFAGAQAKPPSIDVFLDPYGVGDVALSPDGKFLAAIQDSSEGGDVRALMVYRVEGGKLASHAGSKFENMRAFNLIWVNNDRLLVTLQKYDPETGSALTVGPVGREYTWQPPQILALDADLQNTKFLLEDEHKFKYSLNRSRVLHSLPDDPKHILMGIYEDVYKVNVYDGEADLVQRGNQYTREWMTDWEGNIRLRVDRRPAATNFNARNSPDGEWFEIARYRPREVPEIDPIAFSEDPNILYVGARRNGDRIAIYEYNMRERKLGRLVFSHPEVDVSAGLFARSDDHRLVGFRYVIHKPQAEYIEEKYKNFDAKLQKAFGARNFVRPISRTKDADLMVLLVTGPRNPGAYFLFNQTTNRAVKIGVRSTQLRPERLGTMRPVVYKARDGVEINAYFTTPPGNPQRPPLVVMPHGGPEARDYLTWNTRVQFLATRGYAVLQPNFRGSDGFGKKFVEAGYKQWGLKMQDDITDGVRHLIDKGLVDPERICIFGGSYGGYAALAGAAFTPDLYKCAISINGVSDLYGQMLWERRRRYEYRYWKKSIGDPGDKEDRARLKARSPARHAERISAPILIFAGEEDGTVPVTQSEAMVDALEEAGKPHTYIEFEKEGHSFLAYKNRKRVYEEVESFLARHIGPGTTGRRKAAGTSPAEP